MSHIRAYTMKTCNFSGYDKELDKNFLYIIIERRTITHYYFLEYNASDMFHIGTKQIYACTKNGRALSKGH